MTTPTPRPDPRFGDPAATPPAWSDVEALLTSAELYWLTTLRADGRPHTTPLVGVWHDGGFAFCTGVGEQKQVNLVRDDRVGVTTGTNTWAAGTDVVLDGRATRVTGRDRLTGLAAAWREKYDDDWAWGATDDGFTDGEASHPWVYVVRPATVIAFGKDPHSQTAFDLAPVG